MFRHNFKRWEANIDIQMMPANTKQSYLPATLLLLINEVSGAPSFEKPHALATSTGYAGRRPLPWPACNVARAVGNPFL